MILGRSGGLRNLPPVTLNLIIVNFLFFFASIVFHQKGIDIENILGLHYWKASHFNVAQLVSYMFMHANFSHVFFNMFSLYIFGRMLEQVWGSKRFLIYYIITGIGAGIIQEIVWWFQVRSILNHDTFQFGSMILSHSEFLINYLPDYLNNAFLTIGASGAVFGILLAFGMLFPNVPLYILFVPFPIKAMYFVIGYGVLELFLGVGNFAGDNIAHFAHLGGMLFGFFLIKYWKYVDRKNGKFFN